MKRLKSKISTKFFLFIVVAISLVQLPIVGDYVRVLNTVIHESGHAVIALFLWVRNPFGMIWIVSFAFGFLLLLIKGKQIFINHFLLLIASILLVDSIKSAFEIFEMSFIHPKFAGDASNLSVLTSFIPTQAWGIFFFVQALLFPFLSLKKGLFKLEGFKYSREKDAF